MATGIMAVWVAFGPPPDASTSELIRLGLYATALSAILGTTALVVTLSLRGYRFLRRLELALATLEQVPGLTARMEQLAGDFAATKADHDRRLSRLEGVAELDERERAERHDRMFELARQTEARRRSTD